MNKNVVVSGILNLAVTALFLVMDTQFRHWFVIPTTLCGIVCFTFLLQSIREWQPFTDPTFLISGLGYYDTFVAPFLMVHWKFRIIALPIQPDDFRPWLWRLGWINLLGIAIVVFVFSKLVRRVQRSGAASRWVIDPRRLAVVGIIALLASIISQIDAYALFGGIAGYADSFIHHREAWNNRGWLLVIAESGPLAAVLIAACFARRWSQRKGLLLLCVCSLGFLILQTFFGGLRGSRANLVVSAFFAIGIVHQVWGPISRTLLLCFGLYFATYSYVYGFFKDYSYSEIRSAISTQNKKIADSRIPAGQSEVKPVPIQPVIPQPGVTTPAPVQQNTPPEKPIPAPSIASVPAGPLRPPKTVTFAAVSGAAEALSKNSGRSIHSLLISDLSRSDIQCFVLQQLAANDHVELAHGRTYAGALSLMIPRAMWPERLPTKLKWTTALENGVRSTRMYGQVGEAMLNFGYFGVPFAFLLIGGVTGSIAALSKLLPQNDCRRLLLPGLIITSACMIIQDSDNILYFAIQFLAVPFLVVWASSRSTSVTRVSGPNQISKTVERKSVADKAAVASPMVS